MHFLWYLKDESITFTWKPNCPLDFSDETVKPPQRNTLKKMHIRCHHPQVEYTPALLGVLTIKRSSRFCREEGLAITKQLYWRVQCNNDDWRPLMAQPTPTMCLMVYLMYKIYIIWHGLVAVAYFEHPIPVTRPPGNLHPASLLLPAEQKTIIQQSSFLEQLHSGIACLQKLPHCPPLMASSMWCVRKVINLHVILNYLFIVLLLASFCTSSSALSFTFLYSLLHCPLFPINMNLCTQHTTQTCKPQN